RCRRVVLNVGNLSESTIVSHALLAPSIHPLFFSRPRRPPTPTLFPYTTLFRSGPPPRRRAADRSRAAAACRPSGRSAPRGNRAPDRKSTRLNSSHLVISYAVFCLKIKNRLKKSESDAALYPAFYDLHNSTCTSP